MTIIIEEEEIRIEAVDFEHGRVDWRRTTGDYLGMCASEIGQVDFGSMENNIRTAIGAELQGRDNPLAKPNE